MSEGREQGGGRSGGREQVGEVINERECTRREGKEQQGEKGSR